MANYDVGDLIRCQGTFTDTNGDAVDPTTVTFIVLDPSGNETTHVYGTDAEVVRSAAGVYHVDVSIDEGGQWAYRFSSTGTGQAAGEKRYQVVESLFTI